MDRSPKVRQIAWIAALAAMFVVGMLLGANRHRSGGERHSAVTLRVLFQDRLTQPGESVFNGASGGAVEFHQGKATYVFKNTLPLPVKLVFPPIGYTFGGEVSITPQCVDLARMPSFCQEPQTVEFPPGGERRFESSYAFSGDDPVQYFVFGCPAENREDRIFVGEITAVSEIHRSSTNTEGTEPPVGR
jgi:hypothetical protein